MRNRIYVLAVTATALLAFATSAFACVTATSVAISSPENKSHHLFESNSINFTCTAEATPAARTEAIDWTYATPPHCARSWNTQTGGSVDFCLTYLPTTNAGFDELTITATVDEKTATTHPELFFTRDNKDHPAIAGNAASADWPNWYYYWKTTSANSGTHTYGGEGLSETIFNTRTKKHEVIIRNAVVTKVYAMWGNAAGIDAFAWITRHEARHQVNGTDWWGEGGHILDSDGDEDYIPTTSPIDDTITENELGMPYHTGGYNAKLKASVPDDMHYGEGFNDNEDYTMHTQETWTNGDADGEDWSNTGKHYSQGHTTPDP